MATLLPLPRLLTRQVLKANGGAPVSFSISTAELLAKRHQAAAGSGHPGGAQGAAGYDALVAQALHERDATVLQLQQALDAARRRCALLEAQLAGGGSGAGGVAAHAASPMRGGPGAGGLKDVLAQSQMHYNKYRQIRDDYNRLLNK